MIRCPICNIKLYALRRSSERHNLRRHIMRKHSDGNMEKELDHAYRD